MRLFGPKTRITRAGMAGRIGFTALLGGRSAGVPVGRRVLAHIRKGDTARDLGRWTIAATHYRAALSLRPDLFHIHVQHGHVLKEAGDLAAADAAYGAAARLRPDEAEPVLHRAHLAVRAGEYCSAARMFATALHLRGGDRAADELSRLVDAGSPLPAEALRSALATSSRPEDSRSPGHDAAPGAGTTLGGVEPVRADGQPRALIFDVTDLVGHYRHQRLPTGIQRVQVEIVSAALSQPDAADIRICAFVPGRGICVAIPPELFQECARLSGSQGDFADHDWQVARAKLFWGIFVTGEIDLPFDAALVNVGTSLWVSDYFRFIRDAKSNRRLTYIPFVHDLIPVMVPQYCETGIVGEFTAWLAGIFEHADAFLTNSRSTAWDLECVAGRIGRSLDEDEVEVVPLDADFRTNAPPLPVSALDRWQLRDTPFALLVSTIEPRKNHVLAFSVWSDLIQRHGAGRVPRLVCADRDGWLNEQVYDRLAADPGLLAHVTILHHLSDPELSLLYRSSRFTIYPSLYEGWGLPITESLSHGRVPVIADNSALPEAGSGFAMPFASDDPVALAEAVERLILDEAGRQRRETELAAGYRPRSWAAIASQVVAGARTAERSTAFVPRARPGCYYTVRVGRPTTIWPGLANGEAYRFGPGWGWPEIDGCRITAEGGELRMMLAPAEGSRPLRLYVRLRGLSTGSCSATICIGDVEARVMLGAEETTWVGLPVPTAAASSSPLAFMVHSGATEQVVMNIGGAERAHALSVKVQGFLLWDAQDEPGAARVIASIDHWRAKP